MTADGVWREVAFGEIFNISSSKRVLEAQWKNHGVPFYRAREIVKLAAKGSVENDLFISEELYCEYQTRYGVPKPGDLMISAVGTLGACYVVQPRDRFYYKDASVLRFSPKREICPQFIRHAFLTNLILDQVHAGSGSTVGTYTISRANETRIPLPPLAEQRRIAEVLDRAEALRAKRRTALIQLDALARALFFDLFGDFATNIKSWPIQTIGDVSECLDRLRKPVKESERIEGNIPYYGANGQQGWIDRPIFDEPLLLVAEDGGHFENPARGVAYRVDGPAWVNNHAHILRPRAGVIDITYLHRALRHYDFTPYISGTTRSKLTQGQLNMAKLMVPPIELQREFARRVAAVERLKTSQRAALAELDALFASLQHRAFRGEL